MTRHNRRRRAMMAGGRQVATFIGITSKVSATGAFTFPAGTQVGDLAFLTTNYTGGGAVAPTGWVKLHDEQIYAAGQNQAAWYKVLTAGDLAASGNLTGISGGGSHVLAVYRGATSVVKIGYKSNPTNVGAAFLTALPAPSAQSKGWITIAVDRDAASGPFSPGTFEATGLTVRGAHWAGSFYPTTLADSLPNASANTTSIAWVTINGSYGEAAWAYEMR